MTNRSLFPTLKLDPPSYKNLAPRLVLKDAELAR